MARGDNNRGGNRGGGNRGNRGRNNNPEGRNQYSGGVMNMARERPLATALGTAAAVGAGVFLWSRRNQISEQLGNLSDQISEWTESRSGEGEEDFASAGTGTLASGGMNSSKTSGSRRSQSTSGQLSNREAETA